MTRAIRHWKYGLTSAFIQGASTALDGGLSVFVVAPEHFKMGSTLNQTLIAVTVLAVITGVRQAAAYMKQYPLPPDADDDSTAKVAAETQAVVTQSKP